MSIKDLVVPSAWDVFLINSSLVLSFRLLQEGKCVSYCFKRSIYNFHAWLGGLGDFWVREFFFNWGDWGEVEEEVIVVD